ncbi:MAG: cell wall hydrolase [Clostridiales bacterium]|nr:cell wall hydrolase [Clostridiales bacterium]
MGTLFINAIINHVAGGYHQFTPVKNGFINNKPTDVSIKAAWAALYGADPSKGALFYFDDSSNRLSPSVLWPADRYR